MISSDREATVWLGGDSRQASVPQSRCLITDPHLTVGAILQPSPQSHLSSLGQHPLLPPWTGGDVCVWGGDATYHPPPPTESFLPYTSTSVKKIAAGKEKNSHKCRKPSSHPKLSRTRRQETGMYITIDNSVYSVAGTVIQLSFLSSHSSS